MGRFFSSDSSEEEQPERNCLILDDPSTEIVAYSEAQTYWHFSRFVMSTPIGMAGAYNFYKTYCAELVQEFVQSLVRLNIPDWLTDRRSIQERCSVGIFPHLMNDRIVDQLTESAHLFELLAFKYQLCDTTGVVSEGCNDLMLPLSVARSLDLCLKAQKRNSIPSSFNNRGWSHIYDTFLESVWTDELESRGLQVEFVPEWGVHEHQITLREYKYDPKYECLKIVPDAILCAHVDWEPEQAGLTSEQMLSLSRHLEHALADLTVDYAIPSTEPWSQNRFTQLKVPLMVIEYVKAPAEYIDGRNAHFGHARMAMMSVVGLYETLGISHLPVFGLLVQRNIVHLLVHFPDDSKMNQICEVPVEGSIFDIADPFGALRLRILLSKLCKYADTVRDCIKQSQAQLVLDVSQDKWYHWRMTEFRDLPPSPVDASRIDEWRQTV